MQINYIEQNGKKLFSFGRHDYKEFEDGSFIDGGLDYIRTNTEVKHDRIKNLIEDIREQFVWTSVLDKNNELLEKPIKRLLKDMSNDHIKNTTRYLKNKIENQPKHFSFEYWIFYFEILLNELKYRKDNDIFIND